MIQILTTFFNPADVHSIDFYLDKTTAGGNRFCVKVTSTTGIKTVLCIQHGFKTIEEASRFAFDWVSKFKTNWTQPAGFWDTPEQADNSLAGPWKLPDPPAGERWHRDDWTADMLPDGKRPLLHGETPQVGDELKSSCTGAWVGYLQISHTSPVYERRAHHRTSRPLPDMETPQPPPGMKLLEEELKTGKWIDLAIRWNPKERRWFSLNGGVYAHKGEFIAVMLPGCTEGTPRAAAAGHPLAGSLENPLKGGSSGNPQAQAPVQNFGGRNSKKVYALLPVTPEWKTYETLWRETQFAQVCLDGVLSHLQTVGAIEVSEPEGNDDKYIVEYRRKSCKCGCVRNGNGICGNPDCGEKIGS